MVDTTPHKNVTFDNRVPTSYDSSAIGVYSSGVAVTVTPGISDTSHSHGIGSVNLPTMTQMTDSNPEEGEEVGSSVIERDSNISKSSDSFESSLGDSDDVATYLSHMSVSSLIECQEEYFRFRNNQSFEFTN
jgi:hypothetical protein